MRAAERIHAVQAGLHDVAGLEGFVQTAQQNPACDEEPNGPLARDLLKRLEALL